MQKHLFSLVTLGVALSAALGGCGTNVDAQIAVAVLGNSCRINSDCSDDLACVFQRCHEQCSSSRDCDHGSRCVAGTDGHPVCQLEDETSCGKTGACPGAQVCGVDGECRDGCTSDRACLSEQACRSGTCADAGELNAQGQLTPSPDRPAAALTPCAFDSECPGSLVCRVGSCVGQCQTDADCNSGTRCTDGSCVTPPSPQSGCLRSSDCPADELCVAGVCQPSPPTPECDYDSDCAQAGQHCQAGACQCECQSDADCAADQRCQDGCQCVAGRVIEGNVVVNNDRDLAALNDVDTITGRLTIQLPGPGEFHLPSLRHLGTFNATEHKAVLVADVLEDVDGTFTCYQDCRAPRLKRAGSVVFSSQVIEQLELPALTSCGDFGVFSSTQLRSISLPLLDTAGYLRVEGNAKLTRVDMPKLATVLAVNLGMNDTLPALSLPLAAPSVAIGISNMNSLQTISLPAAKDLSSDIALNQNPRLQKLDLSGLQSGRQILLSQMPALSELLLPKLDHLSGSLNLQICKGPSVLELPVLTRATALNLSGTTQVDSVHAPLLDELNELTLMSTRLTTLALPLTKLHGALYFNDNQQLTTVSLPGLTGPGSSGLPSLSLLKSPNLTTLDLSALSSVGNILISECGLTNLNSLTPGLGGALTAAGALDINSNPALPACAVSALANALTANGWTNTITQHDNLECSCTDGGNGAVCQ